MAYPNDEGMFILVTDASAVGIGAVLSQMQWDEAKQQEVERPVAFASRSLTRTQQRYCTTRRELLAVVSFVPHFRQNGSFVIEVDHVLSRADLSNGAVDRNSRPVRLCHRTPRRKETC